LAMARERAAMIGDRFTSSFCCRSARRACHGGQLLSDAFRRICVPASDEALN